MSQAKLNIWLRYADCDLITTCWRTDLVINTCCGEALVDMDPTIVEQLRKRYDGYADVDIHEYLGEKRIKIQPLPGQHRLQHIEVMVPPGCYVVWTRVCYHRNEETNKVMVIVRCGDEACVNLLLDAVETCSNELLYPLLERGVQLGLARRELRAAARVIGAAAGRGRKEIFAEAGRRLEEVAERDDLQRPLLAIREILKGGRKREPGEEPEEA